MANGGTDLLEEAKRFLTEHVAPNANQMDCDPAALGKALDGLCSRNLMALRRPVAYGGPEMSEGDFRDFQEEAARTSGALAFLQTQHQSAVSMLSGSENEALKAEYLPKMADGTRLVGIGFSQLRRPGEPMMRATPTEGGYLLNGQVPWITGWTFYPEFLIGAALPDGRALYGIVPLVNSQDGGSTIVVSPPMRLAAMESAQTVQAEFVNWFLPDERVAFLRPKGWIHQSDLINIALQGFFAIGCARAGLDVVMRAYERRQEQFILDAHNALTAEIAGYRTHLAATPSVGEETTEERLKLRSWAIDLAVRCAHAGITASGGAANSADHPAQRIYREALIYTVSAQTTPIMRATLERLSRR